MSERKTLTTDELHQISEQMENGAAQDVLAWGTRTFKDKLVLACSFGAEDIVLVDMLLRLQPKAPMFYLDTDKHFQETYDTRDRLEEKYNISFIQVKSTLTLEEQAQQYGDKLWQTNPDLCCSLRKVAPLTAILGQFDAWITGIRREQSPLRATTQKMEWDSKFQMVKLNPLADWSTEQVWSYIRQHQLPYNPLHDQNYPSIGCNVCTRPVQPGEDSRAGRWSGYQKTECGLHK